MASPALGRAQPASSVSGEAVTGRDLSEVGGTLGGHGGITAAVDRGALPRDCQTMWTGEWQLLPCELSQVSPLAFVGTGAQNEQALVDWILAVTLLLTCCVTQRHKYT